MRDFNIKRISHIHRDFTIVDGHFDLAMEVERQREYGRKKIIETDHLSSFIEGGFNFIVSSIFIDDKYLPEMALRKALDQISALYEDIDESSDKLMLCKNYNDMEKAVKENKIGILISFEGVEPLYNDINLLRIFYELGVRGLGLTWSRRNFAADGCHFSPVEEGAKGGLTDFGVKVVKEAERLGMFIDVSHLNDEGFWDVMKLIERPVIASHSNSRVIANIMRNLTDKQIKELASKDGVIGVNAAAMIVSQDIEKATIEKYADHIDYLVKIAGVEHVGLGFDFCDHLKKYSTEEDKKRDPFPSFDVIKGHSKVKELTSMLIDRGYTDECLKLIYGENFMRVYKNVLDK
ncbi:dipeptidase [Maledivibacter halophilus]|uniref:Membrane dipeptidase n=1 Tax=Maledivibacter halophilus TaxID=36842 RepID=A0A1T5IDF6_9FIRM|nr:dipeptidase [Maledivibacter halophilus]SKC37100.1 membrane dipeptidase [Maledivibacter halophilus]